MGLQAETEQLIISAMTNDGEYPVDNVGEHAEQIAKVLLFNGYRNLAKIREAVEGTTVDVPSNIVFYNGDYAFKMGVEAQLQAILKAIKED